MSLLEQISIAQLELAFKRKAVSVQEKVLRELEDSRVNCDHVWDKGTKGYEHEGRNCTKCGINELYARTLKQLANTN